MIGLALVVAVLSQADAMDAWEFQQQVIITGEGRMVRLDLPAETLDASRPDLADLRLKSGGIDIPYAIRRAQRRDEGIVALSSPRIQVLNDRTTVEADIPDRAKIPMVDAVILDIAEGDFLKSVTVLGASAGNSFTAIASAQAIFRRPNGASRLQLEFAPMPLTSIRVEIDDRRQPPVAVIGIRVRATAGDEVATETIATTIVERSEVEGESRLVLRLPYRNAFVAGLEVVTDDALFTRRVSLNRRTFTDGEITEKSLAEGTVFRVSVGDLPDQHLRLAIDQTLAGPELTLTIVNHDSPPLAIDRVDLLVVPTAVMFARPDGDLALFTGNAEGTAPRYDLTSLTPKLATAKLATATAAAITRNPNYRAPALRLELDALGAVADVKDYRARTRVALGGAGIYRLELTPTVLTGSEGIHDLRLVRDGHQIPYVADRTGYTRELAVTLAPLPRGENASESRHELLLPLPRLPLTSLSFEVDDTLLDRTVTVLEERKDDRGQRHSVVLGNAAWTRTPGDKKRRFAISLSLPPLSTRLELRIADGDNPPLHLRSASARYTTAKLIFAARDIGDTWLYYGNPKASSPRYDLALIAERLVTASYREAKLESIETLVATPTTSDALTGSKKFLFWVALAVSVAILLAVVVKLLPSTGGES